MADLHTPFHAPLTHDQAEPLARLLKALAEPARLQILSLIHEAGRGGCTSVYLNESLGRLAQPTVSFHLRVLEEAGLISREKVGTFVFSRVQLDVFRQVAAALTPPKRGVRRAS